MIDFGALDHESFMREALREAELALCAGERPIGAVVVYEGRILGRGRAQHQARQSEIAHAELNALLQTERFLQAHKHQCVLYTTVEPCVMCLGAIVMGSIDDVVYALPDHWQNPAAMLEMPYVRRHIRHYLGGVLEAESEALWQRANPRELALLRSGKREDVIQNA